MANVLNGVETLSKISITWVGCTKVTDNRQTTALSNAISRKPCKVRGKLVLITNRKSIWSFDWYQTWWPWMTLNGVIAQRKFTFPISSDEFLVFTALHVMQTRYSEENSVCPSVCPFVCQSVTRVIPNKTEERSVQIFIPYERTFILVFWEEEWLVEGDPFYVKFWVNRPPLERNRRFSTNNRS